MQPRFYNYVLSGNCYKFRLLANILNVSYDSIAVDFHPGKAHKSEEMLQLNPAGTLPILQIGDETLTETQAMLLWLAEHHAPKNTWWPSADPGQTIKAMQWLAFSSRLSATIGELRLHTMLNKNINAEAAHTGAIATLRELESHLTEQSIKGFDWLVGNSPTIADIACFPYTALAPDAGLEHDFYPAIRNWLYRVRSLEGFITMPGIHELHERKEVEMKRL